MPNNNPGDNRLGWSVNAGGNSGGLNRGIMGAALNALGQARRTQRNLHEFDYKENARRETYIQRKAADIATKKIHGDNEYDTAKKAYDEFGGSDDNTTGFKYGTLNISRETEAMRERVKNAAKSAETDADKEARLAKEREEAAAAAKAQGTTTTGGSKKDRSNAATAKAAKAETDDGWAATAPTPTQTPSRTTSNITPPVVTAPKPRKPRAPRAPKNPGQSGGMQ